MNSAPAPRRAVVLGVDGSPASDLALDWALEGGCRCTSFTRSPSGTTSIGFGYAIDGLRQLADGVRTDAVSRTHQANPELVITWDQPTCGPATALVSASETANAVVVGARGMRTAGGVLMSPSPTHRSRASNRSPGPSERERLPRGRRHPRGRSGFAGLLLRSVSHEVMHRTHCPVAIVHRPKEPSTIGSTRTPPIRICSPFRRCTNTREQEPESPVTRTKRTPWSPH